MVRLPKNHELDGGLECASACGARCLGAPPPRRSRPDPRRIEASISLALSPADGAALSHSSRRHYPFLGGIILWPALRIGKNPAWYALSADRAWGVSPRAIFESAPA